MILSDGGVILLHDNVPLLINLHGLHPGPDLDLLLVPAAVAGHHGHTSVSHLPGLLGRVLGAGAAATVAIHDQREPSYFCDWI